MVQEKYSCFEKLQLRLGANWDVNCTRLIGRVSFVGAMSTKYRVYEADSSSYARQ